MKGFTLVEITLVLAIIPILAAVSLPMYSTFKQKTKVASNINAPVKEALDQWHNTDNTLSSSTTSSISQSVNVPVDPTEVDIPYPPPSVEIPVHLIAAVMQETLERNSAGCDSDPNEVTVALHNAIDDIEDWWVASNYDWNTPSFKVHQACKITDTKRVNNCTLGATIDDKCIITDMCGLQTCEGALGCDSRYILEMTGQSFSEYKVNTGNIDVLLHHRLKSDSWRFGIRCQEEATVDCKRNSSLHCGTTVLDKRRCGSSSTPEFWHWKICNNTD